MKYLLPLLLVFGMGMRAQVINKTDSNKPAPADTLVVDSGKKDTLRIFRPTLSDYKYHHEFGEKIVFDSAFSYDKTFVFSQYNNRDNFGRVAFENVGAGFQPLVYRLNPEQNLTLLPENKSFNILGISDIRYYDVKTPTTTFVYHNAVKNGATLYSTYTQNIGKDFNFSANYMGLRSLGAYQYNLASNNTTLFTAHYTAKSGHYEAYAHYLHQNVNNQENGGIAQLDYFEDGDSRFKDRENLQTNLTESNSQYAYRRYYFTQQYSPFNSEKYPFKIRHTAYWQKEKYYYFQSAPEAYYYTDASQLVAGFPPFSKKYSRNFSNTVSLLFEKPNFKFDAGLRYQLIRLGVDDGLDYVNALVPGDLKESRIGAVGHLYMNVLQKIQLVSSLEFSHGATFGNFLLTDNQLHFQPFRGYLFDAHFILQNAAPSFNKLLNSSIYQRFNYYFAGAKNENITNIGATAGMEKYGARLTADLFRIDNYTYFTAAGLPAQSASSLNISQIGAEMNVPYRKFHLNPRVLFQGALTEKALLPMPNFVGRLNFYYQSKAFKKAAEIQAGIKVYYFTKFASREYFPILNEFILPGGDGYSIGGRPIADAYFNLKVKRMTIFIEAQHFDTTFRQNKVYTAPYYPVADFRVNLGIVWYLFQ